MRISRKSAGLVGIVMNQRFLLLWMGQSISVLGDASFDATLALWIGTVIAQGRPWAPFAFSGVYLAATLPALCIGPLAGVFVDRWDKRRTMLIADMLRALLVMLLLLVTGTLHLPFVSLQTPPIPVQLCCIYLVIALISTCSQFFGPSQAALIADVVSENQRTQASALSQVTGNIGWIVGPTLGSVTLVALGIHWAILLNACSFAISFLCILAIRRPLQGGVVEAQSEKGEKRPDFRREFMVGLHFSMGNRVVSALIIIGLLFAFAVGCVNTLYLFFCTENLHVVASQYGLFVALPATGGALGAMLLSRLAPHLGEGRTLWFFLFLWGCVMLVLARQQQFWPVLVLLLLLGVCNAGIGVVIAPLLLQVTPREMIGRVFAIVGPTTMLASSLSIFLTGFLSSTAFRQFHAIVLGLEFRFIDTVYTCTGLLLLVAGSYACCSLGQIRCVSSNRPED